MHKIRELDQKGIQKSLLSSLKIPPHFCIIVVLKEALPDLLLKLKLDENWPSHRALTVLNWHYGFR